MLVRAALLFVIGLAVSCAVRAAPVCEPAVEVADLHVDVAYQVHYRGRSMDFGRPEGAVSARALRAGHVRLLVLSLHLRAGLLPPRHTFDDFLALLDTAERMVRANPRLFSGPDAIRYVFSVEGAHAIAGHEDALPALVARGVRVFGLTHALHNVLADSATDRRRSRGGLTNEGRAFVRAMYGAGGLIDVSHLSDEAFAEVAVLAREAGAPLIATHSNARAVAAHRRNLTDEQLREIARSGGVAGIDFHGPHLRSDGAQATIDDVVRHALHMIAVMGPEHVAIGSDFDGGIAPAAGLADHAGVPALLCTLMRTGVSANAVRAIAYGNAERVLAWSHHHVTAARTADAEEDWSGARRRRQDAAEGRLAKRRAAAP